MSWAEFKIEELGKVVTGKTPSTKNQNFFDGEYQFVTPSDLNYKHYHCVETEATVTDEAKSKHKNQFIPSNSIMFTCIGNTIGKCAISTEECLTNQQINSIIPFEEEEAKFIYYFLNYHVDYIRGIGMGGGAATPIINKSTFQNLKLKAPIREHWARIGNLLSSYDDLIGNNRRRIALLEEAARQLYREWFVGLRFPGHEHTPIVDGVPEGWERVCIQDRCSFLGRGISPQYNDEGAFTVINQKCIRNRLLSFTLARRQSKEFKPDRELRHLDVLINSTGTGTLGRVAQCWIYPEKCTVDSHVTIARPSPDVSPYWFGYALMDLQPLFEEMGEGATNQKELSKTRIGQVELLLPEKVIRDKFSDFASPHTKQITVLFNQNQKLITARDLLLPRLMSGEMAA